MVIGVTISDIEGLRSGRYLMVGEVDWSTERTLNIIISEGAFNDVHMDTQLIYKVIRLNAIEESISNIKSEIRKKNKVLINVNGGYFTLKDKKHIILSQKEFSYKETDIAISWLRTNYLQEEIEYPFLCGILLNTGAFIACKYGEHKDIAKHLLDSDIDANNAIVIGSHPTDEKRSYVHIEGCILQEQYMFLKNHRNKLNKLHKDSLRLDKLFNEH